MAEVKEVISELREKDREHDARLDSLSSQNQNQEFKLKSQVAKDKEHDFRLDSLTNKNMVQDEEIHRQAVKDEEHDNRFESLENRCVNLERQVRFLIKLLPENLHPDQELPVEKAEDKGNKFFTFMAVLALVLSVISLILSVVL